VTFECDVALDDALQEFCRKDRRTKKAVITLALEQYLAQHGHWPPADEDS
jgi:predicted transcriptional regulator